MNIKSSDEHMMPIEDLVNPRAIDYNAEMGHIYFADTTSFLIGRQKIDGSSRETILKDGKDKIYYIFLVFHFLKGTYSPLWLWSNNSLSPHCAPLKNVLFLFYILVLGFFYLMENYLPLTPLFLV